MMNDDKRGQASDRVADLLKRLKETQQAATDTTQALKDTASQISYIGSILQKIGSGFSWVNQKVIEPVLSVTPFTKPMWQATLRQYDWFCRPSESFHKAIWRGAKNTTNKMMNGIANKFRSEKQEFQADTLPLGEFSKSRAGIAILVTAFAASPIGEKIPLMGQFIPDIISDQATTLIYEPPYDATLMGLTALFNGGSLHKEVIYLNGKNEINPKNDVWSVGGCEEKLGCTSEDAVSFHIKPSLMHQAWSWSTGRGPFLADYVAVPIPNVPAKCTVTSYGIRWRVSKWFDIYPILLEAQCDVQGSATSTQPPAPQ